MELDREQDQDTKNATGELSDKIKNRRMRSKDATGNTDRKYARKGDRAPLRAHGYEVKLEVIVDASGVA